MNYSKHLILWSCIPFLVGPGLRQGGDARGTFEQSSPAPCDTQPTRQPDPSSSQPGPEQAQPPVIAVWQRAEHTVDPTQNVYLRFAAWDDGAVLYTPRGTTIQQGKRPPLRIGNVGAERVAEALKHIDSYGFFSPEPYGSGQRGTVIAARSDSRANCFVLGVPLNELPLDADVGLARSKISLWNNMIKELEQLRDVAVPTEGSNNVRVFRGVVLDQPRLTTWIDDAGDFWLPKRPATQPATQPGTRPATRPATEPSTKPDTDN